MKKTLALDDQKYSVQTKLGFLQAGVAFEAAPALPYFALPSRQEVSGFGALKLTDEWSVYGDLRYDFEAGQFIRDSVGLQYTNECVIYSLTYQQTNVTFQDIKPDRSLVVQHWLQGLRPANPPNLDL